MYFVVFVARNNSCALQTVAYYRGIQETTAFCVLQQHGAQDKCVKDYLNGSLLVLLLLH